MGNCLSERVVDNRPPPPPIDKHKPLVSNKKKTRAKRQKQSSKLDVTMLDPPKSTKTSSPNEMVIKENEVLSPEQEDDDCPTATTALPDCPFSLPEDETSESLSKVGLYHAENGNYSGALDCHRRALALHKKESDGLQNEHTAKHYDNLGAVYHGSGFANRAASYYHKALAIRINLHGEEHLSTAESYDKVGKAYSEQGDYERALNFHHKAKHVKKKLLGRNHKDTAMSFWNIGDVHYRKGEYDDALLYFNKAKDVQDRVLEKDHPEKEIIQKSIDQATKRKMELEK
jgi:Tfp pilus assembly protein PilF